MTTLRPYQRAAVDAVLSYWQDGGGDPLVEMATGTGKSIVVATLTRELVEMGARVLMLVHVKELVAQNAQALLRTWPAAPLGINSAGLNRRDRHSPVLFASIQSVAREDHHSLGSYDVILIDEAHLLPPDGEGQYRKLIARLRTATPHLRVVGFTATPYRLGSGLLYGPQSTFSDVVFSYGISEGVADGYLSPLTSRGGSLEIDVSGVRRSGGEFVEGALASASAEIIPQACADMVARLADRRAWLAFCAGVENAHLAADHLARLGITAACVTGQTPAHERDRVLQDFKAGRIRCLTNANVLTTGFDAPIVDAIAMLRPTLSTGLYVQMLGRGTRLYNGKTNCLVLDYAGNVRRHGPVDAIEVKGRSAGGGEKTTVDQVRAKSCPSCEALVAIQTRTCTDCGHEWPAPEAQVAARPDTQAAVMTSEIEQVWHDCRSVHVYLHDKPDGIASMRVEYQVGMATFYREWITLDHPGFAGDKARLWWRAATGAQLVPVEGSFVLGAIEAWPAVQPGAAWIQVVRDGKYWRVSKRRFQRGNAVHELDEKNRLTIHRQDIAA